MNILTFDVEEWFHLLECDDTSSETQWMNFEERIHRNVDRILQILEETNTKATFFVIGWIAKTYPNVVKRIAEKYQIGTHTMNHQLVWQQSREEFRDDVGTGIKMLEDITGQKVNAFRAPGFSIRETEGWAFEILHDLGIEYDASVFPARHAHGGMPSMSTSVPSIIEYNGVSIKEFPVTVKTIMGKKIVFSGGGYFRLFPYWLIKRWHHQNADYLMAYLHPRDMDAGQPMIPSLSLTRRFRSYVGLKKAENKFRRWLHDFQFIDITTADELIDWTKVPSMKL